MLSHAGEWVETPSIGSMGMKNVGPRYGIVGTWSAANVIESRYRSRSALELPSPRDVEYVACIGLGDLEIISTSLETVHRSPYDVESSADEPRR